MNESWLNLHCTECEAEWSTRLSKLPGPDGEFECECGRSAPVREYLSSESDLEALEKLRGR